MQKLPRNSQISVMSDETVDQFVLKPRQRAVSCDFGVLEDDYIRDQVIDKCYSSHLRAKVLFLLVCLLFFFYFSLPSRHRISKSLLSPNTCPAISWNISICTEKVLFLTDH